MGVHRYNIKGVKSSKREFKGFRVLFGFRVKQSSALNRAYLYINRAFSSFNLQVEAAEFLRA
jgi:hypothetical protein